MLVHLRTPDEVDELWMLNLEHSDVETIYTRSLVAQRTWLDLIENTQGPFDDPVFTFKDERYATLGDCFRAHGHRVHPDVFVLDDPRAPRLDVYSTTTADNVHQSVLALSTAITFDESRTVIVVDTRVESGQHDAEVVRTWLRSTTLRYEEWHNEDNYHVEVQLPTSMGLQQSFRTWLREHNNYEGRA